MAYAMRINFVDVVVDNSLKNIQSHGVVTGYQFDIRLSYYRGHFLSVIDQFEINVDGFQVPDERIKFCINGKAFNPVEFDKCYTEFWNVMEPATIQVFCPGGLPEGPHDINVTMYFRSPYMPIGDNHQYMPVDGCGRKTLILQNGGN